jgi:hypothetical protein
MEYAKITLLIPQDEASANPHKWNWNELLDHPTPVAVLSCEYLTSDEVALETGEIDGAAFVAEVEENA